MRNTYTCEERTVDWRPLEAWVSWIRLNVRMIHENKPFEEPNHLHLCVLIFLNSSKHQNATPRSVRNIVECACPDPRHRWTRLGSFQCASPTVQPFPLSWRRRRFPGIPESAWPRAPNPSGANWRHGPRRSRTEAGRVPLPSEGPKRANSRGNTRYTQTAAQWCVEARSERGSRSDAPRGRWARVERSRWEMRPREADCFCTELERRQSGEHSQHSSAKSLLLFKGMTREFDDIDY